MISRARRAPAPVDITPLIDIIFQLVLFFMVSTTFVAAPGIHVDLPRSSAEVILRDRQDVNLWVTSEGSVYLEDHPVTWEALTAALVSAATRNSETLVIVKGDKAVDYGRVVAVMDLARASGLTRLAIATEARAQGGGRSAASGSEESD